MGTYLKSITKNSPIGSSYVEFPNGVLPSNNLLNFDNSPCTYSDLGFASQLDFDNAKNSCMFPNTIRKIAIRPGDVLRNAGQRTDGNGKTIGAGNSTGLEQDHQMQGHDFSIYWTGVNESHAPGPTERLMSVPAFSAPYKLPMVSDGTNGTPLTGSETRMVNTTGRYWIRTA